MSTETESKRLTINLTDHPPVTIDEEEWPEIATAWDWDLQQPHTRRTWTLHVRRHADGRALVYGVFTTRWQDERGRYGGYLIGPDDDIPRTIKSVAAEAGLPPRLADRCIANLPAIEL